MSLCRLKALFRCILRQWDESLLSISLSFSLSLPERERISSSIIDGVSLVCLALFLPQHWVGSLMKTCCHFIFIFFPTQTLHPIPAIAIHSCHDSCSLVFPWLGQASLTLGSRDSKHGYSWGGWSGRSGAAGSLFRTTNPFTYIFNGTDQGQTGPKLTNVSHTLINQHWPPHIDESLILFKQSKAFAMQLPCTVFQANNVWEEYVL